MATTANRTPSGAPSAAVRDRTGMKDGAFPVWDMKSGMNALALRGKSPSHTPAEVIAHVRRRAQQMGNQALIEACNKAAAADKGK